MSILAVTSVEMGERTLQIGRLAFGVQRAAYARLMKVARLYGDESLSQTGLGLFQLASVAGVLNDDDMKFFCETYGSITSVFMGGTSTIRLDTEANRTTVFCDSFQDVFVWLDAATEVIFGATLKALADGQRRLVEVAQAKRLATATLGK
jgi:hypothetical protein